MDAGIGGKTKVFNDVVLFIPPANAGFVTVTSAPDAATVTAGSPIGFTITIANTSAGTASNATLSDLLPAGTNVNWSISPAYTGPGSCSIARGCRQPDFDLLIWKCGGQRDAIQRPRAERVVLRGNLHQREHRNRREPADSFHRQRNRAGAGVPDLQRLDAFAIDYFRDRHNHPRGQTRQRNSFPASGEKVTVMIGSASQQATIGSNGLFTTNFPTATIPVSAAAYPIAHSFAGDTNFGPASDATTKLTVTIANQTVTFGATPATAARGSTFSVSATASSGLPVTIGASGVCTISGGTVTMTASARPTLTL